MLHHLDGMEDHLLSIDAMLKASRMSSDFKRMTVDKLFEFRHSMFPGMEKLKAGEERFLWNPTFNCGVDKPERQDRNSSVARYSSPCRP